MLLAGLDMSRNNHPGLLDQQSILDNRCQIQMRGFTDGRAWNQLIEQRGNRFGVRGKAEGGEQVDGLRQVEAW